MNKFERLFGITQSQIKNTCIFMPVLPKNTLADFGIDGIVRGKLYSIGQNQNFTLIHTGMGPGLCGDAILYLKDTPAENIILFGSCGLVKERDDITAGSLVSPSICYNLESFSDMLAKDGIFKSSHPDKSLFKKLLNVDKTIKNVSCLTVGSLKLEEERIDEFIQKNIQIVDMECSAFFNAAKYIGRCAASLLYVTDILKSRPFYREFDANDRAVLSSCIKSGAEIICKFVKNHLASEKKAYL